MRSLNTSLPRASPRRRPQGPQPPEALLSAFKAAALSVTTLYKTAASDQARSRASGYQDALDDLLVFLDREHLGLGDGEGWRVRQWATERLDGSFAGRAESDDEEEEVVEEDKARSSSPDLAKKPIHNEEQAQEQPTQQNEPEQAHEPRPALPELHQQHAPTFAIPDSNTFSFRSSHPYPSNHDREADNMSVTSDAPSHGTDTSHAPMRVEIVPRTARGRHSRPNNNRQSTNGSRSLGSGAGSKRKIPLGDFFDISGLSFDGKDDSGRGGKKGRHA